VSRTRSAPSIYLAIAAAQPRWYLDRGRAGRRSVLSGATTAGLLFSLTSILKMDPTAGSGLRTGAAIVAVFTLWAAWYLRRSSRARAPLGKPRRLAAAWGGPRWFGARPRRPPPITRTPRAARREIGERIAVERDDVRLVTGRERSMRSLIPIASAASEFADTSAAIGVCPPVLRVQLLGVATVSGVASVKHLRAGRVHGDRADLSRGSRSMIAILRR
jgi:hypothetical protein